MKHSRKYFLDKIFENERVQKVLRELTTTTSYSERDRLSDELMETLSREGQKIVEECFPNDFEEKTLIRMGVHCGLYGHASTMAVGYERLVQIMDRYELLYPEVGGDDFRYIKINDFITDDKKNYLDLDIYYSGKDDVDEKINSIIEQLGR